MKVIRTNPKNPMNRSVYLSDDEKDYVCPTCTKVVKPLVDFKDALSLKEWRISGMCQPCQDSIFNE